jgi:hypothetical protein
MLPACYEANASCIESFGKEVSDAIASWIRKGFSIQKIETVTSFSLQVSV